MERDRTSLLVVDDDVSVGRVLTALLGQAGFDAKSVTRADQALALLDARPFDLVISDVRMPGMDGMQFLATLSGCHPDLPVILLTAHATVPLAVEAMRAGAADFLQKPVDRSEILFVVDKALRATAKRREDVPSAPESPRGIIGSSERLEAALATIRRAAASTATVLVRGESGTGKEAAARLLHDASPRKAGPFVKLHSGALPDSLLESELFGHEKGAFTGAVARKPGRIELAQRGTLFLDEIGDISAATQVKLLRVLQEREMSRLGGSVTISVDVRFVAATNRDLEAMVERGEFREDLYYRLNVVPVWMPPLRERASDIPALARHFCALSSASNGRPDVSLDDGAIDALVRESWPGNVRELQNFVERLVVLGDDVIRAADVRRELARRPLSASPRETRAPEAARGGTTLEARRREAEREQIVLALARAGNNRALAARLLGVSRRTLYNKLHEHGLLDTAP